MCIRDRKAICQILVDEGYIKGMQVKNDTVQGTIVAVSYTHLDVYKRQCPILEPGEKITDSDGIRSLGGVTCETGGTNVRI